MGAEWARIPPLDVPLDVSPDLGLEVRLGLAPHPPSHRDADLGLGLGLEVAPYLGLGLCPVLSRGYGLDARR